SLFLYQHSRALPDLHSFPTRRSSDLDKKHIGHEFKPFTAVAEAGKLRLFCKAIGEEDPIYQSEEAARKAGYPKMPVAPTFLQARSEEHTSELQSRFDLVCRLLLEKKK